PKPVICRDVEQIADALHGRFERIAIGEVTDHHLAVQPVEIVAWAAGAHERTHLHLAFDQGAYDRRSKKARSAGDKRQIARSQGWIHRRLTRTRAFVCRT